MDIGSLPFIVTHSRVEVPVKVRGQYGRMNTTTNQADTTLSVVVFNQSYHVQTCCNNTYNHSTNRENHVVKHPFQGNASGCSSSIL